MCIVFFFSRNPEEKISLSLVQELLPQHLFPQGTAPIPVTAPSHITPTTANFVTAAPAQVSNIPVESLSRWAETVAMILPTNMTMDASSALTVLGDCLAHNQWTEAAHVWWEQSILVAGILTEFVFVVTFLRRKHLPLVEYVNPMSGSCCWVPRAPPAGQTLTKTLTPSFFPKSSNLPCLWPPPRDKRDSSVCHTYRHIG